VVTDKISSDPLKCTHYCSMLQYWILQNQTSDWSSVPSLYGRCRTQSPYKEGTELSSCAVLKDSTNTQYPHNIVKDAWDGAFIT